MVKRWRGVVELVEGEDGGGGWVVIWVAVEEVAMVGEIDDLVVEMW